MKIPAILISILFLSLTVKAQSTASQNVHRITIEAPELDSLKGIWIYLPADYKDSKKKYPVIYMHDAQNLFDQHTSFAGEWKIDESLDSIGVPQSIIVGIEHGGSKRIDELTPFSNEKYGGGKGDDYLEFIVNTLKPFIDSNYRTKNEASNTSIFGSSLGGLISFYAVIKYPEIFGKAGIYSPSFWFSPDIFEWTRQQKLSEKTKFYFLAGTDEGESMQAGLEKMMSLLCEKGLKNENYELRYIDGGKHNEALWSRFFPDTYKWLNE